MLYNTCQDPSILPAEFDVNQFQKVHNKEEFCSAAHDATALRSSVNVSQALMAHLDDRCKKQSVSTIFMCEDDSLIQTDKAMKITQLVREAVEKMSKHEKNEKSSGGYSEQLDEPLHTGGKIGKAGKKTED